MMSSVIQKPMTYTKGGHVTLGTMSYLFLKTGSLQKTLHHLCAKNRFFIYDKVSLSSFFNLAEKFELSNQ